MEVNNTKAVCPACGAELFSPEALFCVQCGASVSKNTSANDFSFDSDERTEDTISVNDDADRTMSAEDFYQKPSIGQTFPFGQPPEAEKAVLFSVPDASEAVDPSEEPTCIPASVSDAGSVNSAPPSEAVSEETDVSSDFQPETLSETSEEPKSVFDDEAEKKSEASDVIPIPVISVQQPTPNGQQSYPNGQPFYPNGQQPTPNGQQAYPNGQQPIPNGQQSYPNGQQFYPNGQQFYPNGQPFYPNGQQPYPNAQPFYPNGQQPTPNGQPFYLNGQQPYPNPQLYGGGWQQPVSNQRQKAKNSKNPSGNRPKNKWVVPVIVSCVAGLVLFTAVGFIVWTKVLAPSKNYDKACSLMEEGKYDNAIALFEDLGDYKDSGDKITESKYQKACQSLEDEEYQTAETMFKELGDYRDSEDKAVESKYRYGISLIEDEFYTQAISVFEELDDYSDSADYLREAKYLYCKENGNCTDSLTYEYMKELKKAGYKDSESMYHALYDLRIEVIYCNNDSDDEDTILYSVSKYSSYFHIGFSISGGTPDETFNIYRVVTYPDGNSYNSSDDPWINLENGSTCSIYWSEGFFSDPAYGVTGKMYIDLYNQKTKKRIKRVTVKITE